MKEVFCKDCEYLNTGIINDKNTFICDIELDERVMLGVDITNLITKSTNLMKNKDFDCKDFKMTVKTLSFTEKLLSFFGIINNR